MRRGCSARVKLKQRSRQWTSQLWNFSDRIYRRLLKELYYFTDIHLELLLFFGVYDSILLSSTWSLLEVYHNIIGRLVSPMATAIGYRKLDLPTNEIRLIRLLPAPATANYAAIRCVLEHASLSNPPSFIALSYQWGD
jgi:hypothetical protein